MPRTSTYPIEPLILNRYSPRALSGKPIQQEELFALFEAARWAPSSYNGQPWRFIFAYRETEDWDRFFKLLTTSNQTWAKQASALVVVVSLNRFDYNGKPSRTHSFDTGAAWENLALEASARGLIAHGMEGFDYDQARKELGVPADVTIEMMIAIGYPGDRNELPEDMQKGEEPNDRRPLEEIIMEGRYRA